MPGGVDDGEVGARGRQRVVEDVPADGVGRLEPAAEEHLVSTRGQRREQAPHELRLDAPWVRAADGVDAVTEHLQRCDQVTEVVGHQPHLAVQDGVVQVEGVLHHDVEHADSIDTVDHGHPDAGLAVTADGGLRLDVPVGPSREGGVDRDRGAVGAVPAGKGDEDLIGVVGQVQHRREAEVRRRGVQGCREPVRRGEVGAAQHLAQGGEGGVLVAGGAQGARVRCTHLAGERVDVLVDGQRDPVPLVGREVEGAVEVGVQLDGARGSPDGEVPLPQLVRGEPGTHLGVPAQLTLTARCEEDHGVSSQPCGAAGRRLRGARSRRSAHGS